MLEMFEKLHFFFLWNSELVFISEISKSLFFYPVFNTFLNSSTSFFYFCRLNPPPIFLMYWCFPRSSFPSYFLGEMILEKYYD